MNLNRILGSTEMYLRKNAPTILTGVGAVGLVATAVLAAKATLEAEPKYNSMMLESGIVKERKLDDEFDEKERSKQLTAIYVHHGKRIAKDYALPVAVGGVSIAAILSAHGMMQKRQASLLAAYATLDAGFKAYRKRVQEELGEERERDIWRGVDERKKVVDEDGKPCIIDTHRDNIPSPYAKFFDEASPNFEKTPEYNLMFLRSQQNWANNRLRAHGFVFLNEVYESLGLPRTQAGQVVGWKLDGDGDGHIDFGMYDDNQAHHDFINGYERAILLDFNVDGPISI